MSISSANVLFSNVTPSAPARPTPPRSLERIASPAELPFIAVIGLHSSGSGCLAGLLYHLGIFLGKSLGGHYGSDPETNCGFEAVGLTLACEAAVPFPAVEYALDDDQIVKQLGGWIKEACVEARNRGTLAGGKYPQLCRLGGALMHVCGSGLKVLHSERPVSESVRSVIQREPRRPPQALEAHQHWLYEGKLAFLGALARERQLTVEYDVLLTDPRCQVERITRFLQHDPSEEQAERALRWVDPGKKHW